MANIKFSAFDATDPVSATIDLVAAKSGNNIRFTPADLAPFTGIYAANGTIGTTRKALITDTIQFRNAGDTKDVFKLNTNGAFALGLEAANTSSTNVCVGIGAATPSVYGVAIGRLTSIGATASYATVIGNQSTAPSAQSVVVGAYSTVGFKGATLGYGAGSASNYAVNIGNAANGSGVSSITLNANSGAAAPSTANAFGVYMSSSSIPDFEVVGGGMSTLNTSLKITGQAYTELHTGATPADPDWNNGNIQEMTLASSDQDFDPSNAKAGATYILKIKQPSSGAAGTINWNAASATVLWPSPGEPTLSTANNAVDIVTLICVVGGASGGTYYANATLNFS